MGAKQVSDTLFRKYGVNLEYDRGLTHSLMLDAPPLRIFKESDCHVSCALPFHGYDRSEKIDWKAVLAEAEAICKIGFEKCQTTDCDVCDEIREHAADTDEILEEIEAEDAIAAWIAGFLKKK